MQILRKSSLAANMQSCVAERNGFRGKDFMLCLEKQ